MKACDLIKHLKTLPQDLELWVRWDESGECWPMTKFPCEIVDVAKTRRHGTHRWEEYQEWNGKRKSRKSVILF